MKTKFCIWPEFESNHTVLYIQFYIQQLTQGHKSPTIWTIEPNTIVTETELHKSPNALCLAWPILATDSSPYMALSVRI